MKKETKKKLACFRDEMQRSSGERTLLAGCIPKLKSNRSVVDVYRLGKEVNANRGLIGCVKGSIHKTCNDAGLAD